jgi:hypothetical protein
MHPITDRRRAPNNQQKVATVSDATEPREFESEGSIVINRPIQEVFDWVTAPHHWIQYNLGNIAQYGPGGEGDTELVKRTPKVGEVFTEVSITPAGVYWEKDFEVHLLDSPHRWGFTLVGSRPFDFDADLIGEYTLESIEDGSSTRWTRKRITRLHPGKSFPEGLHSLADGNKTELEYQRRSKAAIEDGQTEFEPIAPRTKEEAAKLKA